MTTKGRHGDDGLVIGRRTMQPIYDFLANRDGRPFFIWYAPMMPHEPHNPPQRLLDKHLAAQRETHLARYYAMCEWFDETVGELLGRLREAGLSDSTLVVFAIDNGWIQSIDGPPDANLGFAPRSKRSPYDGGVRTPILISWPGRIRPGRREDLVSTIDVAPTVLAACGVEAPAGLPGLNLLPTAESGAPLNRDAVFGEIFEHTCIDIERPGVNLTHRWIRQGPWKLIAPADLSGERELYNLVDDPFEKENLASRERDVVDRLQRRLDAWWEGRTP
jgi:uncharacterized sulfatase